MRIRNTNKDRANNEYIEYLERILWVLFVFINNSSCFLCYSTETVMNHRCCDIATVSSLKFS